MTETDEARDARIDKQRAELIDNDNNFRSLIGLPDDGATLEQFLAETLTGLVNDAADAMLYVRENLEKIGSFEHNDGPDAVIPTRGDIGALYSTFDFLLFLTTRMRDDAKLMFDQGFGVGRPGRILADLDDVRCQLTELREREERTA